MNLEIQRIYSIKVDGSDLKLLTRSQWSRPGEPVVSPKMVELSLSRGYLDKVQTYQVTKLYMMNIDGSNKREIKTNLDRSISSLRWAPDGKGVYFKYDNMEWKDRLYIAFWKNKKNSR